MTWISLTSKNVSILNYISCSVLMQMPDKLGVAIKSRPFEVSHQLDFELDSANKSLERSFRKYRMDLKLVLGFDLAFQKPDTDLQ